MLKLFQKLAGARGQRPRRQGVQGMYPLRKERMKKKKYGKTIFNGSILILSVGLLVYFCVSEDGLVDLASNIDEFRKEWLALGFLGMLGDLVLDGWLIQLFTKSSAPGYRFRDAMKSGMVGHFYSAVTPFQSGGQPMQVYLMAKQGVDPGVSTAAMVQKFLVYQTCLTIYSAAAILLRFSFFSQSLPGGVLGLAVVGFIIQGAVIGGLVLFSFNRTVTHRIVSWFCAVLAKLRLLHDYEGTIRRIETQLEYFHESNAELFRKKKLLVSSCVLTFLQQTSLFSVSYCVYRAFGLSGASAVDMICAQAFVTMVSCMVPLPGAAGASEGSFYVFFSMFFTSATIKPATLLWRIITYYSVILITAPFSRITRKMQESAELSKEGSLGEKL